MAFTLFLGCNIPARVKQYEMSAKAICQRLNIDLETIDDFVCCGYPMRTINEAGFILSAVKNLAVSEQYDRDIMVLCKCCYGSLKAAQHHLKENPELKDQVNEVLANDGLTYSGNVKIRHFLSVLHEDVGQNRIKNQIRRKYQELKIAASVGCHALRPSKITEFDNAASPGLLDDLVRWTGAKSVDWSKKSECCGAPLVGINDELSLKLMCEKISNARDAGANYMAVACPWTFLMFDRSQPKIIRENPSWVDLKPVLYSQLLGLSMGISARDLGFEENKFNIMNLESYLSPEE